MAVAARREVVRQLQDRGLSERQALKLVGMSASTLRYEPRDDGNGRLRERLTELAGQHRRHGYRMLHSRLRIDGWAINVKRTYRVYREEGLMVRKRRRKKLPVPERQPLVRPIQPNEVWSMDFVFDELANGRRVKTLTVVDDCSKEAVQIAVDTSIPAAGARQVIDAAGLYAVPAGGGELTRLAREGEHIGAVQALRNSTPPSASRSMFGVLGASCDSP